MSYVIFSYTFCNILLALFSNTRLFTKLQESKVLQNSVIGASKISKRPIKIYGIYDMVGSLKKLKTETKIKLTYGMEGIIAAKSVD